MRTEEKIVSIEHAQNFKIIEEKINAIKVLPYVSPMIEVRRLCDEHRQAWIEVQDK